MDLLQHRSRNLQQSNVRRSGERQPIDQIGKIVAYHVLDAMVAICGIVERTLLVNNVNASLLSADLDLLDIIRSLALSFQLTVKYHSAFDSGLSVESTSDKI